MSLMPISSIIISSESSLSGETTSSGSFVQLLIGEIAADGAQVEQDLHAMVGFFLEPEPIRGDSMTVSFIQPIEPFPRGVVLAGPVAIAMAGQRIQGCS